MNLSDAVLLSASQYDRGRRVYLRDKSIYKILIRDLDDTSHLRQNSLKGEFNILSSISSINCIPEVVSYRNIDNCDILKIKYVDGITWQPESYSLIKNIRIALKVYKILALCSFNGIAHNDVKKEYILIPRSESCYLIDLDQAQQTSLISAYLANMIGISTDIVKMKTNSVRTLVKNILPQSIVSVVGKVKRAIKPNTALV